MRLMYAQKCLKKLKENNDNIAKVNMVREQGEESGFEGEKEGKAKTLKSRTLSEQNQ